MWFVNHAESIFLRMIAMIFVGCVGLYILLGSWKVMLLLPVIAVLGSLIVSACFLVFLQVMILGLKWLGCLRVVICA